MQNEGRQYCPSHGIAGTYRYAGADEADAVKKGTGGFEIRQIAAAYFFEIGKTLFRECKIEVMEGGKQMEMDKAQFAEKLKALLDLGKKKKNVLEYQEINDFFQGITLTTEQMDLIFEYLEANGIDVLRITEDDALLESDDLPLEEEEVDMENIDLSVPEGVSIEDLCGCI